MSQLIRCEYIYKHIHPLFTQYIQDLLKSFADFHSMTAIIPDNTHTHSPKRTHTHTNTHSFKYIQSHTHTHILTHQQKYTHTCTHTHTHTHTHTQIHKYIYKCLL